MHGTMQDASHTDRRYSQTRTATPPTTWRRCRRPGVADHVFGLVRGFLGSRVLEVGSGIGTMTQRLVGVADHVVGIEPNPNCVTRIQEAMGTIRGSRSGSATSRNATRRNSASQRFDSVLLVNVLEHIAEDVGALKAFKQIVIPGGGGRLRSRAADGVRSAGRGARSPSPLLETDASRCV